MLNRCEQLLKALKMTVRLNAVTRRLTKGGEEKDSIYSLKQLFGFYVRYKNGSFCKCFHVYSISLCMSMFKHAPSCVWF